MSSEIDTWEPNHKLLERSERARSYIPEPDLSRIRLPDRPTRTHQPPPETFASEVDIVPPRRDG